MSSFQQPEVSASRSTRVRWTTDPAPFLEARTDEDHQAADSMLRFARHLPLVEQIRATTSDRSGQGSGRRAGIHVQAEPDWDGTPGSIHWVPMVHRETAEFAARFNPDRAELDAAARYAIVRLHRATDDGTCRICMVVEDGRPIPIAYPCMTLRTLTWPYADHPDYDKSWEEDDADFFGGPSVC
ncbi:DUF6221 family protein [Nocardioides kongjuensis]|uniref:Uncharacterized protein n=1 Tax=Nocardioides kongjuensis TaxID=349522 RepID=A0A852RXV7_9ACTN|nr:DUF6221 family protein [Nocardioides kongjuensis]NYD32684.1 hypothetical protein [Nocardioides kongjuensis]